VLIEKENNQITHVKGDPDHPANYGRLCTKGATLALTVNAPLAQQSRLKFPQLRSARGAAPAAVSWDQALTHASQRLIDIVQQHGADALGFYVSGQFLTEDYYVFNKLVKGLLGSNQIDTNSRLCMSSAVAGYKLTLGADAPPACYDDVNHAQTIFITGSNTAWAHPVLFRRIEDAKANNPALKIVVVDPRRTDTAAQADLYLPIQPGTDVALFHGMLHIMLWEGWLDTAYMTRHTRGFATLKELLRDYTPDHVATVCGLPKHDIYTAARWFAGLDAGTSHRTPTLSLYCQGLNQSSSGTAKNASLINLHLATGQIGKPGAGPFSLTGQPNAMGGREVGGMANLLSAHRDLANPVHRAEVAALWGVDSVPQKPGRTAIEMFQAAADGEVKALWIACTNPAQSLPNQSTVRRALQRAEFVVVQEAFANTATCDYADLLLPATTWGEKDGTLTNSERRISRLHAAVAAPLHPEHAHDGPRHDWQIGVQLGQRLEAVLRPGKPTLFPYTCVEHIWNEHRESTRGRDLDITGLSYSLLETPQQWPYPDSVKTPATGSTNSMANTRLYADGVFPTADGMAQFACTAYEPLAELRSARYPFSLTTGRLRDHWHGLSRTGKLGRLFGHVPEPVLQMHPHDMARRGFVAGELVRISSARGTLLVPLEASDELAPAQVFMAMHWGSEVLSGQGADGLPLAGVNALTTSAYCPSAKQPEFKHTAVRIDKADLPWTLLGLAWVPEHQVAAAQQSLQTLMSKLAFTTCVPFGRERTGLLFRAAHPHAPDAAWLDQIELALGLHDTNSLRYADAKLGQRRVVRLQAPDTGKASTLQAFLLAGDTRSQAWIKTLLQDELPVDDMGQKLLMPSAQAPLAMAGQSQRTQICACFNVSEQSIAAHLKTQQGSPEQRLASLQDALKCGTQCGSCRPALKKLVVAA